MMEGHQSFFLNQFIEIPRRSIIGCFLKFLPLVAKAGLNRTLFEISAGIFKQSMGARNRVGIGLSYRPARLHRLSELAPWKRFLGSFKRFQIRAQLFMTAGSVNYILSP
jgi:hypothetical protein